MNKFRFTIFTDVLLIVLLVGGGFLLMRPFSPGEVEGAFYAVKFIGDNDTRYQLFGDEFSCAPIEDLPLDVSCRTMFEGESLAVRLRYQDQERRFLSYCEVSYGETAVDCEPSFGYESMLPFVLIRDDLGVSAERFAELRAERPLLNWPEATWLNGLAGAAILLAVLMAVWRWFRFRAEPEGGRTAMKVLTTLLAGLIAFLVLFVGGNLLLSYIWPGPEGPFSLVPIGAILGTGLVVFWQWRVHRGWRPSFGRLAYSLAGGTAVLVLTIFFGGIVLLLLGFID